MKELIPLFPEHARSNFFPGLVIGLISWIISSPVLGSFIDFGTSALLGQLIGGIALGSYSSLKIYSKIKFVYVLTIGLLIFSAIYSSGITVALKTFIDTKLGTPEDGHFAFAYMVAYAAVSVIVVGFWESFKATSEIKNIFPNIVENGLSGVGKFNLRKDLLDTLVQGDYLYWLDTYCPDSDKIATSLENAIKRKANVRILTININSANVEYRAKEIHSEPQRGEIIDVKKQIENWQGVLLRLYHKLQNSTNIGKLEVSCYQDFLGMPMYIHIHNGQPVLCYTGFYLNKSASNFVYLKWIPSNNKFIEDLETYFNDKWKNNKNNIIIPPPNN